MAGWRRTYWSVWTANLITSIGMMSFLPFFPSLLEEMGLEGRTEVSTWAGVIFGAAPLSATLMSPIWGALGDRVGRKVMVLRAMLAIALFVGCMGFATSPWQLLALRIGQGLFSGFIPPSITLVSLGAPPERQGRVAGDLTTALALGAIAGPMLGGLIAAATSYRSVFFVVGALALISCALVAIFAEEDADQRQERAERVSFAGVMRGVRDDMSDAWGNRKVRGMVVLIFFLQFGMGATNPVLELYVRELFAGNGVPAWMETLPYVNSEDSAGMLALATSLLFTGMALANLVSLPVWGRYGDRVGHKRALLFCALGSALALGVQAAAPIYLLLLVGRAAMGVAMAGTGPLAFGLAASEVSIDRRGGAFGIVFSARTLAVAIGGSCGGYLSAVVGIRGVMLFSAVLVLVATAFYRRARSSEFSSGLTRS